MASGQVSIWYRAIAHEKGPAEQLIYRNSLKGISVFAGSFNSCPV